MTSVETPLTLDIVIPVYNEGPNILSVLESFARSVRTPYRVLICYDRDDDDTLPAVRQYLESHADRIDLVKNRGRGALGAVMTGIEDSTAPYILTFPADDDYNAGAIDALVEKARQGNEIVCASRFIPGGCMVNCPWLKDFLVRAAGFTMHHLARLPTHDTTNGLRLFSRRVVTEIPIESTEGFCYSIEWLVKAHRLGWKIDESPIRWFEREAGKSRFLVMKWLPKYLRWYFYAFATTYLRLKHVELRNPASSAPSPSQVRQP